MAAYVKPEGGERVLLDTKKAHLRYEEKSIDLTGATLSFYDSDWSVLPGTVGDGIPCRIFTIRDRFTGLAVEIPFVDPAAVAVAFADDDGRRRRKLRRLAR